MEVKHEIPDWLSDIVYRLKQSRLLISVDEIGQLQFSDSLKIFLKEIISLSQKDEPNLPRSQLSAELTNLGVKEIEEISTAVAIVIGSQDQKITHQSIQYQLNFFPAPAAPVLNTFNISFGLPREFPAFTGRIDALNQLKASLSQHQNNHPKYIISGTSGVGKTQLAVKEAHRQLKQYQDTKGSAGCRSVIWFIAGTDEGIDNQDFMTEQFHRLGQQLGFDPEQLKLAELIRLIFKKLDDECGPYLVIFDNAYNFLSIKPYLPASAVRVIVTSCNSNDRDWGPSFKAIPLDIFTETEAQDYSKTFLIQNHAHLYHENEIKDLAKTIRFPLALTQALAYIAAENIRISDYLKEFEQQKALYLQQPVPQSDPYQDDKNPTHDRYATRPKEKYDPQKATIWAVIQLSLRKVQNPDANQILKACAYLAPEAPIDTHLLANWTANIQECRDALTALRRYSLLENVTLANHVRIHQVVQEILRLADTEEAQGVFLAYVTGFTGKHFEKEETPLVDEARQKTLFPHLQAILEHFERLPEVCKEYTEELGILQGILGNIYLQMKNYVEAARCCKLALKIFMSSNKEFRVSKTLCNLGTATLALGDTLLAKTFLEQSLDITERIYGSEHQEVAKILTNLGNATSTLGDAAGAKALFERALIIKEFTFGSDHHEVACGLVNLSYAIRALGDAAGAKALLERALPILVCTYGSEHPTVAVALSGLGNSDLKLGDAASAKVYFERALAIKEHTFGSEHAEVANVLVNLGDATREVGDAVTSKTLLERALTIKERIFGPEHSEVAVVLLNLGNATAAVGETTRAKILFERALPIYERTFGLEHPDTALVLMNLANLTLVLGNNSSAAKVLLERALAINERTYGPEHTIVARTLGNLSTAILRLGNAADAKTLAERALKILEREYGPNHPKVAGLLVKLGSAIKKLGDLTKAKALFEKALNIEERTYGPEHPEVAETLMSLGGVSVLMGNAMGATILYERALAIEEKVYGPKHPKVAVILRDLGLASRELGNMSTARAFLEHALAIQEFVCGFEDDEVGITLMNLGVVISLQGDAAGAIPLLERALAIKERIFGPEHPEAAKARFNLGLTLRNLKQSTAALKHFQHCFRIFSRHLGDQHATTQNVRYFINELETINSPSFVNAQSPTLVQGSTPSETLISEESILDLVSEDIMPLSAAFALELVHYLYDIEQFQYAILVLDRVIAKAPTNIPALLLKARCLGAILNFETAEECLGLAISCGGDLEAQPVCKDLNKMQNDYETMQKKIQDTPTFKDLAWRDKVIYLSQLINIGKRSDALRLLKDMARQVTEPTLLAPIYYQLARCHYLDQRWQEALECIKQSLAIKQHTQAKELQSKIMKATDAALKIQRFLPVLMIADSEITQEFVMK